jgi:hypothetical protein
VVQISALLKYYILNEANNKASNRTTTITKLIEKQTIEQKATADDKQQEE